MKWLSGLSRLVGLWMVVSPWVLGFSHNTHELVSAVISGAVVFPIGGYEFFFGEIATGRKPGLAS